MNLIPYPSSNFPKTAWFILLLLEIVLVILLFIFPPQQVLGILIGIIILPYVVFSPRRISLLLIFIVIVLPIYDYWFFMVTPTYISFMRIAGILFIIIFEIIISFFYKRKIIFWKTEMDLPIIALLIMVSIGFILGLMNGNRMGFALWEFITWYFFIFYFVIISLFNKIEHTKWIIWIIIFAGIVVSLEYIASIIMNNQYLAYTGRSRIVNRQANLVFVSFSYLLTWLIYEKRWLYRLGIAIGILLCSVTIIVSQQRSLWLVSGLAVILIMGLYFIQKMREHQGRLVIIIGLIVSLLVIGISVSFLFNYIMSLSGEKVAEEIVKRGETLEQGEKDDSLLMRLVSYGMVWERSRSNWLLGCGLGDAFRIPILRRRPTEHIDSSYVNTFWKIGLVGVILMLWIYIKTFFRTVSLYKSTSNIWIKKYAHSTIVVWIGLFLLGLFSIVISGYRFNIVWAALIAVTEICIHIDSHKMEAKIG